MKQIIILIIFSFLICNISFAEISTYKEYVADIPTRSDSQNALIINSGNEPLVLGVEYMRMIRLGVFFPYMSIGAGIGSWIYGPALWTSFRFYPWSKSKWAPFVGISPVIWNGVIRTKSEGKVYAANVNAFGFYLPLGIQYYGRNGIVFSFEIAAYIITTMKWDVEEVEGRPKTTFAFGEDTTWKDIRIWGGIKIGFDY